MHEVSQGAPLTSSLSRETAIKSNSHQSNNHKHSHRPLEPNDVRLHHLQQVQLLQPAGGSGNGYPQLSRKFVARRISEGETGRLKEELKCQACGKGYKHVSSLAKHLWEHTPEWNVTSKLLISKHQQVQLLEAASILVSMNEEEEEEEEESNGICIKDEEEGTVKEEHKTDRSDNNSNTSTPSNTPGPVTPTVTDDSREGSNEPYIRESSFTDTIASSIIEPRIKRGNDTSIIEQLTPAHDIPILSGKPIHKTPSKNSYHRRMSSSHAFAAGSLNAGSLNVGSFSMGRYPDSLLCESSPLPEAVLAKDFSHHPPSSRHRSFSTHHTPSMHTSTMSSIHARASRDSAVDEDEDGLQDPHDEDNGQKSSKDTQGDVFGDLEV